MADEFVLPGGAGLGTAPMGGPGWQLDWGPSDPDESVAAVRAAVAAGAGWIDTAPFYGWGGAEEIVGSALDEMAARPVVLTKCGDVRGPDGRVQDDHSASVIRADVRASLRRLRCPVIDVLQLHDPDPATPIEESWQRRTWSTRRCRRSATIGCAEEQDPQGVSARRSAPLSYRCSGIAGHRHCAAGSSKEAWL
jgi:aryl-alcohol dehydrogenase-like predicted oxidoreductase